MEQNNIRNFSIIAHIDHGKSHSQTAGRLGALSDFTSSAEMNSACGKVLLGKTLGTAPLGAAGRTCQRERS